MKRYCRNCMYFKISVSTKVFGICKRYPPTPQYESRFDIDAQLLHLNAYQPGVLEIDTCGEYVPKHTDE